MTDTTSPPISSFIIPISIDVHGRKFTRKKLAANRLIFDSMDGILVEHDFAISPSADVSIGILRFRGNNVGRYYFQIVDYDRWKEVVDDIIEASAI